MADSSANIVKETFFAADMCPEVKQYSHMKASTMLSMLVRNSDRGEPLSYSKATAERLANCLPKEMVGLAVNSKGGVCFSKQATADFLGAGTAGSTIAGSGIAPILVMDSIMEGAMAYTCARDILPVVQMRSETETMPFFTARGTVPASAYGAEAYDLAQEIGKGKAEAKSYKLTCGIAGELLADAQGDLLASALKEMGGTMELTLDSVAINGLIDNAYATTSAAATVADALKGLIAGQGAVGGLGYRPDAAIMEPIFCANVMASFIPSYNPIAQEWVANTNILAKWGGMKLGRSGITPTTATDWRWTTAGDAGALVIDSTKAGKIGLREDMKFDQFENIVKWITNPVLISRFCYVAPVDAVKTARNNKGAIRQIVRTA